MNPVINQGFRVDFGAVHVVSPYFGFGETSFSEVLKKLLKKLSLLSEPASTLRYYSCRVESFVYNLVR